jgi:PIN domain nuclease of toxin-antitoxin system
VIVLDTHVWIWLASDPERLSEPARRAIKRSKGMGIAAISCWELAMLAVRRRIELDRDPLAWIEDSLEASEIELLPLTPAIAVASAQLADFHGDPADRLIVATALTSGASLVTKDDRIASSGQIDVIW